MTAGRLRTAIRLARKGLGHVSRDRLRYEKSLLEDWLRAEFAR